MKVHTKFWPDQEIEVGPAEHTDLARWGLLIEPPTPVQDTPTPESAVAVRPSATTETE